jgi:hypothetical protein
VVSGPNVISAPLFGSLGGGINVFPYASWIANPNSAPPPKGGGNGKGGGKPRTEEWSSRMEAAELAPPPQYVASTSSAQAENSASETADISDYASAPEFTSASFPLSILPITSVSRATKPIADKAARDVDDLFADWATADGRLPGWLW